MLLAGTLLKPASSGFSAKPPEKRATDHTGIAINTAVAVVDVAPY